MRKEGFAALVIGLALMTLTGCASQQEQRRVTDWDDHVTRLQNELTGRDERIRDLQDQLLTAENDRERLEAQMSAMQGQLQNLAEQSQKSEVSRKRVK